MSCGRCGPVSLVGGQEISLPTDMLPPLPISPLLSSTTPAASLLVTNHSICLFFFFRRRGMMWGPLRPTGPFPRLQRASRWFQSSWVQPMGLTGTVQHRSPPRCWALPLGQWDTHPPAPPRQRPDVVSSRVRAWRLVAKWLGEAPSLPSLSFHVFSLEIVPFCGTRWALWRRD